MSNHQTGVGGGGLCQTPEMLWRIANLTASYSYGDKGKDLMNMVSAPVITLILIVLLLGGVFNVNAVLSPSYRRILSSAFTLSLPVMSYLFSEASKCVSSGLSLRAKVILTWMLLTELLRKKVDEIRPQGVHSGIMARAGRVVWLGSLVYFNVSGAGQKALFSILWILCATKLAQRVAFIFVWWRSHFDKSWIISSYMDVILCYPYLGEERVELEGHELLRRCRYIVMGEEKLRRKVTAAGYKLDLDFSSAITVDKVWELCQGLDDPAAASTIRRACFSFALFKLLRGRYGFSPQRTSEEVYDCRRLLVQGLSKAEAGNDDDDDRRDGGGEMVLFQVMADEVKFLTEYIHSVVPVVIASPKFVLYNYVLFPAVVLCLCLVALLICGHGGMDYVLGRIVADNNYDALLQPAGFLRAARCTLARAAHSRPAAIFALDLSVTALLVAVFFLEEMWELLVVLISNWFMISMIYSYYRSMRWGRSMSMTGRALFRLTLWLRSKMRRYTTTNRLKQLSLLHHPCVSSLVPTSVPVSRSLKRDMVRCLLQVEVAHGVAAAPPLANLLRRHNNHIMFTSDIHQLSRLLGLGGQQQQQQCVTEAILAWHIATCLLEYRFPISTTRWRWRRKAEGADNASARRKVAVSLSRYCAYLMVFHPGVLPDRRAKAELVVEEAKKELECALGVWHYYSPLLPAASRARKLLEQRWQPRGMTEYEEGGRAAVQAGVMLGKMLIEAASVQGGEYCWDLLAEAWTELLVYVAAGASRDVEHAMGLSDMLKEGVELITVLWAFGMHTGVGIPPVPAQRQIQPLVDEGI